MVEKACCRQGTNHHRRCRKCCPRFAVPRSDLRFSATTASSQMSCESACHLWTNCPTDLAWEKEYCRFQCSDCRFPQPTGWYTDRSTRKWMVHRPIQSTKPTCFVWNALLDCCWAIESPKLTKCTAWGWNCPWTLIVAGRPGHKETNYCQECRKCLRFPFCFAMWTSTCSKIF